MFKRTVFNEDHEMFRDQVRRFVAEEITPHHAQWEKDGHVSRDAWRKAGENGLLCAAMPEEYGGAGADFLFSMVVMEELAAAGAMGPGFSLHSDIVAPYILHYGSHAVKHEWLPKMAAGEAIGAIAMTEPAAGSDVQGIKPPRSVTAMITSSTAKRCSLPTAAIAIFWSLPARPIRHLAQKARRCCWFPLIRRAFARAANCW